MESNSVKIVLSVRTGPARIAKIVSGSENMQTIMRRLGPSRESCEHMPQFVVSKALAPHHAECLDAQGKMLGIWRLNLQTKLLERKSANQISWEWK